MKRQVYVTSKRQKLYFQHNLTNSETPEFVPREIIVYVLNQHVPRFARGAMCSMKRVNDYSEINASISHSSVAELMHIVWQTERFMFARKELSPFCSLCRVQVSFCTLRINLLPTHKGNTRISRRKRWLLALPERTRTRNGAPA